MHFQLPLRYTTLQCTALHLHDTTRHHTYTTLCYTALHYTTLITLHYTEPTRHYTTLHYAYCTTPCYNYTTLQLGEVATATTPKSTTPTTFRSNSGFVQFCHPFITITHLSYSFLSLNVPPPPCAVLLVLYIYICQNIIYMHTLDFISVARVGFQLFSTKLAKHVQKLWVATNVDVNVM